MSSSELAILVESFGRSYGTMPKPRLHGGTDPRSPSKVIAELGLKKGITICLPGGQVRVIRKVVGDEVFVDGVRGRINIYGITLP